MGKLTVSLVMCPCWGRESPPLVLGLLGGILRSHGFRTHLFDLNARIYNAMPFHRRDDWSQESYGLWQSASAVRALMAGIEPEIAAAVAEILATGSHVVGFSLLGSTLHFTLEIARRIKAARPQTVIMLGGAQASKFYSGMQLIEADDIDAIVLQEGDETLPAALNDLAEHGHFRPIPGLLFKRNGTVVDGGPRPVLRKLDDLPFADYRDFDLNAYAKPNRLDIYSSRSCLLRCHYCDESTYFERFRYRSGHSLFDEVCFQLRRHPQVSEFNFSDSVLNGSIPAIREFCRLIVEHGITIRWGGQAVIRTEMTAELLQLMAQAGCAYLSYGVDSGSDTVLRQMNKKLSSAAVAADVLRHTHQAGIGTYANFMFGYPGESEADFLQTLQFINVNRQWLDGVSPAQSFMVMLKNTHLYQNLDQFGIDPDPHPVFWQTRDGTNTYPIRLLRYEMFCKLCLELGLDGGGVMAEKTDKWALLGAYHLHQGDVGAARECYRTQLLTHGHDPDSLAGFTACSQRLGSEAESRDFIRLFKLDHPRSGRNTEIEYALRSNDSNWTNGFANGWATAFIIADGDEARRQLAVGRHVHFADGSARQIASHLIQDGVLRICLDGPPLDGRRVGYPHKFTVKD